ncbi:MAG TPA: hypothetical protein VM118_04815 [Acidobacteriota bacterium]|nr:hypothetical protein [Acidobacteriota bacterium]
MTESKRKRLLFAVFIAAIILGLAMRPWERRRPHRPAESVSPPSAEASEAAATVDVTKTAAGVGIRFATAWPEDPFGRRDATTPLAEPKPVVVDRHDKPTAKLQGIMHVDGRKVCVIGRRTLAVGETVDGWKIAAIGNNNVLLTKGAQRLRLDLR